MFALNTSEESPTKFDLVRSTVLPMGAHEGDSGPKVATPEERPPMPPSAVAYCTDSAGMDQDVHTLLSKIRTIGRSRFTHIELAWPDLEAYADKTGLSGTYKEKMLKAAKDVRLRCEELGLYILAVHPFTRFEGYTTQKKKENLERAQLWFDILTMLGCDLLQVGSSDDPDSSSDMDLMVRNFRDLADLAANQSPPIRIAYEMWAWGEYINTWEQTWEVCKRVDRPNFGLCLDTFQICARTYISHLSPPDLYNPSAPNEKLGQSLYHLTNTIPPEKIYYLQISDGSNKISAEALAERAKAQKVHPLCAWSNAYRPLPYMKYATSLQGPEEDFGGFLPVMDVIKAVLATGWEGPWSYEVFYEEDMKKPEPAVTLKWVNAAMACHEKILEQL